MTIKLFQETNSNEMKQHSSIILLALLLTITSCKEKARKYDASGSFEAIETMIAAESNGKIMQFDVTEGQQLDPGQVIGYIDSIQLHLNKVQMIQNKRAILSGRPQTNLQVDALRKELASAVLDRDRTKRLVDGGVASQKQLDDANARVSMLQSKITAQQSSLQTTNTSITEQGSTVDAQLREMNEQLKKSVLINPLKGTVLTKYAEQYEMAVVGKPLYKIADLSTITLRAYVTGDQLQQVKVGQQVLVSTDDGKGGFRESPGTITWINDKSEFTPKTIQTKNERANLVYAIKVNVKNEGYLKIGMYGQVSWTKQ
jgi:HlyD family secretion protein